MKERLYLDEIKYNFSQEGNTNGTTNENEELTVTIESCLGSIEKEGGFLTIRTSTGWSVNDSSEFLEMLQLVENGVKSDPKKESIKIKELQNMIELLRNSLDTVLFESGNETEEYHEILEDSKKLLKK